jgi:lysophospholipase L1-like esterase
MRLRSPAVVPSAVLLAVLAVGLVATSCGGDPGGKVGLVGDSITDLSRDPLQQALGKDHKVEIVGKFGARSDEVIADVKVIAASGPNAAIVNIGTNDALQQVPVEQTVANVGTILDELGDVGCRYLVEINEGITVTATGESRAAEASALNEGLRSLADDRGVDVIAWNETIAEGGGNGVVTYDTVHLSTKGVVLLADTYRQALDDC